MLVPYLVNFVTAVARPVSLTVLGFCKHNFRDRYEQGYEELTNPLHWLAYKVLGSPSLSSIIWTHEFVIPWIEAVNLSSLFEGRSEKLCCTTNMR